MSWNLIITGERLAVKEKINNATTLPQQVKEVINLVIDDNIPGALQGVLVKTSGHIGGGYGSISELSVVPCEVAFPLPKEPPKQPS